MDGGELKGAVLTFADMTETKAAEESLRRAVLARDEVLAVVSHDLRNPVSTVVSAAGLLLEIELPPEQVKEHLRAMKRSAERMNRLIQDLLEVARLEAGKSPVHPSRIPVLDLLDEVVGGHAKGAESRGVGLAGELEGGLEEVWGDRDRLVQVLTNLVENALKFTPSGGKVEVSAHRAADGAGVVFSVSDTGEGISREDQDRLFDRFWQVGRRDSRGAGLGLSIVKGLVEAHGGKVWVESEPGKGSTFRFSLPGKPRSLD
jgi:signal transduction histidine kinase